MRVAIIKYNAGNTRSVALALERLGVDHEVTDTAERIATADKVIIPGVGEARSAMEYLNVRGLDRLICSLKQPTLGICLGMQLMCETSEEGPCLCLGIFKAPVKEFVSNELRVPHTGWNSLEGLSGWPGNPFEKKHVYYVHSYYVPLIKETTAQTEYGIKFSAAIRKNNFYGIQFHAEKSADTGTLILQSFLEQKIK